MPKKSVLAKGYGSVARCSSSSCVVGSCTWRFGRGAWTPRDRNRRDHDDVADLAAHSRGEETSDLDRVRAARQLEIQLEVVELGANPARIGGGQLVKRLSARWSERACPRAGETPRATRSALCGVLGPRDRDEVVAAVDWIAQRPPRTRGPGTRHARDRLLAVARDQQLIVIVGDELAASSGRCRTGSSSVGGGRCAWRLRRSLGGSAIGSAIDDDRGDAVAVDHDAHVLDVRRHDDARIARAVGLLERRAERTLELVARRADVNARLGARDLAAHDGDERRLALRLGADQDRVVLGAQDVALDDARDRELRDARARRQLIEQLARPMRRACTGQRRRRGSRAAAARARHAVGGSITRRGRSGSRFGSRLIAVRARGEQRAAAAGDASLHDDIRHESQHCHAEHEHEQPRELRRSRARG